MGVDWNDDPLERPVTAPPNLAAFVAAVALAAGVVGAGVTQAASAGEPFSLGCNNLNLPYLDSAYNGAFPFTSTFQPGETVTLTNDATEQTLLRAGVADEWPAREFRWSGSISYTFTTSAPYGLEWVTNYRSNWTVTCSESLTFQHYAGYEVDGERPDFSGEDVFLTDQFVAETVHVGDARMLLTPVQTRREGSEAEPRLRPNDYLKCYRTTGGARWDHTVRAANRFTSNSRLLIKEPNRLCTPASMGLDGSVLEPPGDRQNYKCYRVEETPTRTLEVVELIDEFGVQRAVVRRAEQLCTPVTLNRIGGDPIRPPRPSEDLVCYGISELQTLLSRRVFTLDEFGLQSVRVFDPLVLCVPSTT